MGDVTIASAPAERASTFVGIALVAGASIAAIVLGRPERVPAKLEPPARSESSRALVARAEGEAEPVSAEAEGDVEPPRGYALTRMDLEAGLLKVSSRMMACRDEATPQVVPLKIQIAPSGAVAGVVLPPEVKGSAAGDCIARAVRAASFPAWSAPPNVPMVEWSYPLRFDAAE